MRTIAFFKYLVMFLGITGTQVARPDIPRAWDDREVATFQVPLAQRDRSPRFMTSEEYYKLKVRPIYRTYPIYLPGREPVGYLESLKQKEPEIVFDPSKLQTEEDWIRAGELVFEAAPTVAVPPPEALRAADAQNQMALQWVSALTPPNRDGIIPYARWVVIQQGVVQPAIASCAACHTRVMPDGTILKGAQGDFALNRFLAKQGEFFLSQPGFGPAAFRALRDADWELTGASWISTRAEADKVPDAEWIRRQAAMQPGVIERHGTSNTHPSHVPSLIGIKDLKYLDATGLVRHRSVGDLMRYVVANYGIDMVAHFGDFQPSTSFAAIGAQDGTRYSDEQLYALAMYLYSLKPPPNPNRFDDSARRGQQVFQQQGCATCHTPPLYTNNSLTPAPGFTVPEDLRTSDAIMNVSVGSDPTLATSTRRGTGFYKVPSLRGVWYRNAFGHNGQADTLEEWFDPARLRNDYVPKGFHLGPGPIKGHQFGLNLPAADKRSLIAFLHTL